MYRSARAPGRAGRLFYPVQDAFLVYWVRRRTPPAGGARLTVAISAAPKWRGSCTACFVYGIFSKNYPSQGASPAKGESGCKGNNFRAYPPNFRGTFFRVPGEPEGSFPKAGAKVGLITANAKLTGNFFGSFLDEKTQSTGKLRVRNKKRQRTAEREKGCTPYIIL